METPAPQLRIMKKQTPFLPVHAALLRGFCCLVLCCLLSRALQAQTQGAHAAPVHKATASYTYKLTDAAKSTFGYDIYQNGRLVIHQPSVPALPGQQGFKTKAGAASVAQLVIKKMQKGEMPPTVSLAEMKKLKAL